MNSKVSSAVSSPTHPANYKIQPYLFFEGRSEEAAEFYQRTLGAEVLMLMRFKDSPDQGGSHAPADKNKVLHMSVRIGDTVLMGSDGSGEKTSEFKGFALSLAAPDDAEAARVFAALSDGGKVRQPLMKTFFASSFGMVTDRFGVMWMVTVMSGAPS